MSKPILRWRMTSWTPRALRAFVAAHGHGAVAVLAEGRQLLALAELQAHPLPEPVGLRVYEAHQKEHYLRTRRQWRQEGRVVRVVEERA